MERNNVHKEIGDSSKSEDKIEWDVHMDQVALGVAKGLFSP